MTLAEAVREAIFAFFDCVEQNDIIYATYTGEGLRIDSTLIDIPMDRIDVPKIYTEQGAEMDLKLQGESTRKAVIKDALSAGDKVAVAVHHGGQRYSVLYKL